VAHFTDRPSQPTPTETTRFEQRTALVGIAPGPEGLELRTFECRKCNHSFTNAVAKDPMNTVAAGWLAGELKSPT
jgi:hypothetical protein